VSAKWCNAIGGAGPHLSHSGTDGRAFYFYEGPFSFAADAEIGIEVDPRVTSRAHLETLRKLGFNRLSMGIQDFHPEVQQAINRVQPFEQTRDLLQAARQLDLTASTWI